MIKKIMSAHLWLYLVCGVFMAQCWDWPSMVQTRHQYLLGIFYNEHFKNFEDGIVYFSYYLRQKPDDIKALKQLQYCYEQLGDKKNIQDIEKRINLLSFPRNPLMPGVPKGRRE